MFISSAARKEPDTGSEENYNLRPVPMRGTRRRNPDEYFVLSGRRSPIVTKPWKYRSNSQLTLSRSASSMDDNYLRSSVTKSEIDFLDDNGSGSYELLESSDQYMSDEVADDQLKANHRRAKGDTIYVEDPLATSWYTDPVHRAQTPPLDFHELARRNPLQASILRSSMEGSLYPMPEEDIRRTPVEAFDLSLFKNAEEEMLSSRTFTALTSPYQYKLAQLKMQHLKLEEDRLLNKKTVSELERIRGPTLRWYEMKTPGFHVEAKKNNQILASKGNYQEIMEYRNELLRSLERTKNKEKT